jgi:hydroxymethylglutaryl-CoA reductase (NADPH)
MDKGKNMNIETKTTQIDTRWIGPFEFKEILGVGIHQVNQSVSVPLATYETTLFFSVARGARVIKAAGGLKSTLLSDTMSRSVTLECKDANEAYQLANFIKEKESSFQKEVVEKHSKYANLKEVKCHFVANLIYIRFVFFTHNAAGHNMVTLMSDRLLDYILTRFPDIQYVSLSGNMCVDKKVSAINGLEGRGKHIISELVIPRSVVIDLLKTTPEAIVNINTKKNLLGSIMAGSLLSANAHYANMLLAFYLPTGQDAANIVEGSQGITYAELRGEDLYFSVSLPNIIVGTVGNGKGNESVLQNLTEMGCIGEGSSQRLAHLCGGVVLAGELSLLAALTNQHELMKAHVSIERK